ncbi:MAG TPA: site-2 protease family protein [Actinomycetota bacterium]|jgi:Zn-dependent protease|nr:site-2 protease family protein [Actinomycetota bacterium]
MTKRRRPATVNPGGFRVGFDWSVRVMLALLAWSLATWVLPFGWPGHSQGTYWLAAVAAAGLFLGCLVAHELSHAITARHAGVEVESITFWLFGGMARIRGELATPRLLVAGIGPLTSLLLAGRSGALGCC